MQPPASEKSRSAQTQADQQTRTQIADELSFARCVRHRGVSRFPDPNAKWLLTVAMVQAQGIDVHSPQVLRVIQACLPASHGGSHGREGEGGARQCRPWLDESTPDVSQGGRRRDGARDGPAKWKLGGGSDSHPALVRRCRRSDGEERQRANGNDHYSTE